MSSFPHEEVGRYHRTPNLRIGFGTYVKVVAKRASHFRRRPEHKGTAGNFTIDLIEILPVFFYLFGSSLDVDTRHIELGAGLIVMNNTLAILLKRFLLGLTNARRPDRRSDSTAEFSVEPEPGYQAIM